MPVCLLVAGVATIGIACGGMEGGSVKWGMLTSIPAVIVGIPVLVSVARVWGEAAKSILHPTSRGGFLDLAQIGILFARIIFIFKLPPKISGSKRWFAFIYYGSMILFALCSVAAFPLVVMRSVFRW